ncbi:MAG: hypothetical protein WA890_21635 [Micromonospora sp.]
MSVTDHGPTPAPGPLLRHASLRNAVRAAEAPVAPMDSSPGRPRMISVAVTDGRPWIAVETVA